MEQLTKVLTAGVDMPSRIRIPFLSRLSVLSVPSGGTLDTWDTPTHLSTNVPFVNGVQTVIMRGQGQRKQNGVAYLFSDVKDSFIPAGTTVGLAVVELSGVLQIQIVHKRVLYVNQQQMAQIGAPYDPPRITVNGQEVVMVPDGPLEVATTSYNATAFLELKEGDLVTVKLIDDVIYNEAHESGFGMYAKAISLDLTDQIGEQDMVKAFLNNPKLSEFIPSGTEAYKSLSRSLEAAEAYHSFARARDPNVFDLCSSLFSSDTDSKMYLSDGLGSYVRGDGIFFLDWWLTFKIRHPTVSTSKMIQRWKIFTQRISDIISLARDDCAYMQSLTL
jgi:hypothetical protein